MDGHHTHPCVDDGRELLAFRFGAFGEGGHGAGEVVGNGCGEDGVLFDVEFVQHIQYSAAEGLGHWRAGEHGHEKAAAQGEDEAFYRERLIGVVSDFTSCAMSGVNSSAWER